MVPEHPPEVSESIDRIVHASWRQARQLVEQALNDDRCPLRAIDGAIAQLPYKEPS